MCIRDRATIAEDGNLFVGQVVAASDAVGVTDSSGLDGYDLMGQLVSETPGATQAQLIALDKSTAVFNERDGMAIAVDLLSGEQVWQTTGWVANADDSTVSGDAVYLCRGQDSDGLTAVDAATGEDLWETSHFCSSPVSHGELVTVVSHDPNVDGGNRVTVVDAATGELVSDEALFDGIDDQVNGFDYAIAVGTNTVTAGTQADLVVLAQDGTELARQTERLGTPLGQADGVAIFGSHEHVLAYDVTEQTKLWTLDIDAFSQVAIDNSSILVLDRANGTVSRLDASTGEPRWTTPIGATTGFAAAATAETAYILTTQALIAVDNTTGEVVWSEHRSLEG